MTNLEIILIAVLWVFYGVYHGQRWSLSDYAIDGVGEYILSILFAPVCLLIRIIKGILLV